MHFNSSGSSQPNWEHFTPEGTFFCLEAGIPLSRNHLILFPLGLDLAQETLVQALYATASLGLSFLTVALLLHSRTTSQRLWVLTPGLIMGFFFFSAGVGSSMGGSLENPLLLIRLMILQKVCYLGSHCAAAVGPLNFQWLVFSTF